MGDEGQMYVKEELLEGFKTVLAPLATVLTPNQFEAELLTGMTIGSMDDALRVAAALHDAGPDVVVRRGGPQGWARLCVFPQVCTLNSPLYCCRQIRAP